jgi:hypothetical protein
MGSEFLRYSMSQIYTHIKPEEAGAGMMNSQRFSGKSRCQLQRSHKWSSILDKRIGKKTRRKQYFEYLVKWKGHPVEDASWENEAEILKHGQTVQELMDRSP